MTILHRRAVLLGLGAATMGAACKRKSAPTLAEVWDEAFPGEKPPGAGQLPA